MAAARALVIGLTGGIASGKTAVSDRFAALGVPVVDADLAAREVVAPGAEGLAQVREAFGDAVLTEHGELDRQALRRVVFAAPQARRRLEAVLHPLIRQRLQAQLTAAEAPYVLLVIPLLVETGMQDMADRILVVDVPEAVQRERLAARDASSSEEIDAILASQASRSERLACADDVVANDGDLASLDQRVAELHQRYLRLAAART